MGHGASPRLASAQQSTLLPARWPEPQHRESRLQRRHHAASPTWPVRIKIRHRASHVPRRGSTPPFRSGVRTRRCRSGVSIVIIGPCTSWYSANKSLSCRECRGSDGDCAGQGKSTSTITTARKVKGHDSAAAKTALRSRPCFDGN
ncbi:hypothetical protein MHUMG1_04909 [Metarhizium humberi]|uniref:Uncharacterized protein n=1 Tax=Metarhizium humberi TaxID=2596975 RepID=A0A9P8MC04_9HYPO|nr:hypothetical protein MHUMG1_04909 [Metarhizium humberi]